MICQEISFKIQDISVLFTCYSPIVFYWFEQSSYKDVRGFFKYLLNISLSRVSFYVSVHVHAWLKDQVLACKG